MVARHISWGGLARVSGVDACSGCCRSYGLGHGGGWAAEESAQVAGRDQQVGPGDAEVGVGEDCGVWLGQSGLHQHLGVLIGRQVAVADGTAGGLADPLRQFGQGEGLVAAELVGLAGLVGR